MALPKVHRLRHRRDFSAVYRLGRRHSTLHLTLVALKLRSPKAACEDQTIPMSEKLLSEEVFFTQIGISISQKVSKRAVVRNRIKRQIRSAMQQLLPQIPPGWKIVIVVKPTATQCDYEQFLQELKQLLKKSEVVNGY
ncbi:MAG: ribonuclease P protein component [Leptolyngbyaceae cyanobacterium SL_5_9]|nr:ribonuclease P protein component [Leptolyngbyaceae cyanobacterium SL_5_9]NJO76758.1 ribonuclease P protein component [Leptolyngbyaceae cyanobacterium RM1_406_9]